MQAINNYLFGTPEQKVKKWQQQLKQESRLLDREIRQLDLASNKVKAEVKKLAQKGDTKNAKLLAREVVRSNKQKDRLHTSQARLNSINMQLSHQLGTLSFLSSSSPHANRLSADRMTDQPRSRSRGHYRSRQRS